MPHSPKLCNEQPWASPMPGEKAHWFQRFSTYIAMGASRSVRAVYSAEQAAKGKPSGISRAVPSTWHQASHRYEWTKRAEAFDEWRGKAILEKQIAIYDTLAINHLQCLIIKMSDEITVLQHQIQQLLENQPKAKKSQPKPLKPAPQGFVWLSDFAEQHGISSDRAEDIYSSGKIQGQRIRISSKQSSIAITAKGQTDFCRVAIRWEYKAFRKCDKCSYCTQYEVVVV
jgi:hypothetical protein